MAATPRCCVYTTLYGDYDPLPAQPARAGSTLDFIAFVPEPDRLAGAPGAADWSLRRLPPRVAADPARSARYAKMHPHRLLPEYDASLYIDCSVLLTAPPEALFDALLFGQTDTMACLRHGYRDNVPDEVLAVLELDLDSPEACFAQLAAYAEAGWQGRVGLTWSGLLLRFHHDPRVVAAMELWWEQVLRFSRRDQLSFAYVAEALDFPFVAHDFSNRESPWHRWPHSLDRPRAPWRPPAPPPAGTPFAERLRGVLAAIAPNLDRSQLEAARLDIAALTAERDTTSTRLAATEAALAAVTADRDQLASALAVSREEMRLTRDSTSWRLTAPLRAAMDAIRRPPG